MTTTTQPTAARAGSAKLQSWQQYMTDLRAFAAAPLSLETQGTLVKVAGLVLEAAGIRVADSPSQIPKLLRDAGVSG